MGLKDVIRYLQHPGSVTPVTPEKFMGLQREPSVYAGCTCVTPVTPHLGDTQQKAHFLPVDKASNDPEPPTAAPAPLHKSQGQRYQEWVATWKPMADAYHAHHFTCPTCISAGKGYGLRCGAGAALWTAYTEQSAGDPS